MAPSAPELRRGEYASRGDYHRIPDPNWEYYPTYQAKLEVVRAYLDALPAGTRVLDAGCGEGVLVDEYATRLAIEGIDDNYSSERVRHGSVTAMPYADGAFDRVLCLDVLEHVSFDAQRRALDEFHRVLKPSGELLLSLPNLAHLQSRLHFLLRGVLIRTAAVDKHPGDRPITEYLDLAERAGFRLIERQGIFPTVPIVTRLIRRHPARFGSVHRWLTRLIPVPGWCFLNIVRFRRQERP